MSSAEHNQMVETITRGLEIAEREMLEEKARNNEDVIVCGDDDDIIRHIPAKNFLQNVKIGIKLRLFRQKWLNLTTNGGINAKGSDYWNALFCA